MSEELAPTGEATAATDDGAESTATEQPKQDDYQSKINDRLDQMMGRLEELAQRPAYEPPAEEEDDEDQYPLDEGDDGYEAQELQRYIQDQIQQGVQQALTPIQQQQNLERRDDAYAGLMDDYPDLADPDKAKPYVEAALNFVDGDPAWVDHPRFVELIEKFYKADKADERAAQETPADGRTTPLERDGGAAPSEPEEELQDRLAKVYKNSGASF